MKVLVIGLGSMGKRRIRLLKQIDKSIEIVGLDARADRRAEVEKLGNKTIDDLKKAENAGFDLAFICTSPLSHAELISSCLELGLHVFTEINLVSDAYEENMKKAREKGKILFLSSTFLYRDEIQYIQKKVQESETPLSYQYHIGQYLPDWHPWESYQDYFIGQKKTNGCREIMAIELPWLVKTFGAVKKFHVLKGKKTSLQTDYEDSYLLLLEHESGAQGTLAVDVVSRKAVRNLEIYGEDLYLSWNGNTDGLKQYNIEEKKEQTIELYDNTDRQEGYASFIVENEYYNEIKEFLDVVAGKKKSIYGFEDDLQVLSLIDEIENSKE